MSPCSPPPYMAGVLNCPTEPSSHVLLWTIGNLRQNGRCNFATALEAAVINDKIGFPSFCILPSCGQVGICIPPNLVMTVDFLGYLKTSIILSA